MKLSSIFFTDLMKKYDFSFFAISTIIFMFGIVNLYSATHASADPSQANLYQYQIVFFIFSLVVGFVISFISPKNFFRSSYFIYGINVILLILVMVMGHSGMGAQRWLAIGPIKFQPSELMKISAVLALAKWYSKRTPEQEIGFKELILPGLLIFIPTILVVLQPDLGTGLLIVFIFFIMSFYKRLKWKTIGIIALLGVVSGLVMYNYGLKEYQQKRIIAFLDPEADVKGFGYNAIQSKIAIGSGRFFGKGFQNSSQASLSYLPENHTDFAFSMFNEEHGFFGSILLISLYVTLFFRFIWLATSVNKFFDALVAIGILGIFFCHVCINMSMVMGLMPVVGIPLPYVSYGGTSLLTFGIACGMATSISNSRTIF